MVLTTYLRKKVRLRDLENSSVLDVLVELLALVTDYPMTLLFGFDSDS